MNNTGWGERNQPNQVTVTLKAYKKHEMCPWCGATESGRPPSTAEPQLQERAGPTIEVTATEAAGVHMPMCAIYRRGKCLQLSHVWSRCTAGFLIVFSSVSSVCCCVSVDLKIMGEFILMSPCSYRIGLHICWILFAQTPHCTILNMFKADHTLWNPRVSNTLVSKCIFFPLQ